MRKSNKHKLEHNIYLIFFVLLFALISCHDSENNKSKKTHHETKREVLERLVNLTPGVNGNSYYRCKDAGETYSEFLSRYGKPFSEYTEQFSNYNDFMGRGESGPIILYPPLDEGFKNVENFTLRFVIWHLGGPDNKIVEALFLYFNGDYYAIATTYLDDKNQGYE